MIDLAMKTTSNSSSTTLDRSRPSLQSIPSDSSPRRRIEPTQEFPARKISLLSRPLGLGWRDHSKVVNDGDMYLWRELGVNSWLTFAAVVGPNGRLLAQHLEKDNDPRLFTSPLKFPGKLAVDVENNRLFISDSNHIRIVYSS